MPSVTPRAEDGLWDHLRKSVADRAALAQRQTWAIQDGTRTLPVVVNSGIGSTVPVVPTWDTAVTFPSVDIVWTDTPTIGNLLVAQIVIPNSNDTDTGPATGWTESVSTGDSGLYWRIADGTSPDTAFALEDAQPNPENWVEVLMVAAWEILDGYYAEVAGVPTFSGWAGQFDNHPPFYMPSTTIATAQQLLLYCVNVAEDAYSVDGFTVEDETNSISWPIDQLIAPPEKAGFGYYSLGAGYTLTDVYADGTSAEPVVTFLPDDPDVQVVSTLVYLNVPFVQLTSTQQTVMHMGQLPSNTPTENPPNPALPSPNWVSPSRPLHGIQIISDKAEVIFQADQEHGCVFIDGGGA